MKGLVFDTENQMQFKDFGEPLLDNLQKEVGGCIEVVHPKYLPEGLCMVIDDEGLLKGYAINSIASILYGTPEHGQPIVGTAVILREGFVAGELDFMSLDDGDEVGLIENRERVRDNGSPAVDAGLAEIISSYEENIGSFPPAARDALMSWREIFADDLILLAIKKAALSGVRKWNYINGILKSWKNEGVKTLGDVQARDQRRKPPAGQQPKRSAADDYDEIFGELLGGSTT